MKGRSMLNLHRTTALDLRLKGDSEARQTVQPFS
jgi:hypothetical protein